MRKVIAAAMLTAAVLVQPAAAQVGGSANGHAPGPPSVLSAGRPTSYNLQNDQRASAIYSRMVEFGRCATNVAPELADRALGGGVTAGENRIAVRQLLQVSRGCQASHAIRYPFLQASLAEAGYQRLIASGASLQHQHDAAVVADSPTNQLGLAAACIVSRAPGGAGEILATRPGSASERQSIATSFAQAGECGRVDPSTLGDLAFLRGEIALAAYRSLQRH